MPINQDIPSFSAGELSPYMAERNDVDKYLSGCSILENFIVLPYGGVYRRAGTEYVSLAKSSATRTRLIPFNYSTTTSFMLEFGVGYVRFYYGGTSAAQAQVQTSPGVAYEVTTPYGESDLRQIQFVQINDVMFLTHPDHPRQNLSRFGDQDWVFEELQDDWPALLDENLTAITLQPSAASGTGITVTASAPAWITATDYKKGDYVSDSGSIYKAKDDHTSGATFAGDLTAHWTLYEQFSPLSVGSYYQLGAARTGASISQAISSVTSSSGITVLGSWEFTTYGLWTATVEIQRSTDKGVTWDTIRSYKSVNDRNVSTTGIEQTESQLRISIPSYTSNTDGRAFLEVQDAREYGFVKITGYTSATVVTADVKDDLAGTAATKIWSEGAWSDIQGYPRTVALHEQRIVYGGTRLRPQSIWASFIDDFQNFRLTTNDDSGLFFTLSSTQANAIQWMVSQDRLLIGTAGDEWTFGSDSLDSPITPSNARAALQTSFGSKFIKALVVNDVILFIQRQGRKVRELVYSFDRSGWSGINDITILSEHVTQGEILEIAYQQQPDTILWTVTGAGQLVGTTYEKGQNVVGWHRHTTQGSFESVATIYSSAGPDEVWFSVLRNINGVPTRFIERFNPDAREQFEASNKMGWWYLDCAKRVQNDPESDAVTGFDHLNGETVDILADGAVSPSRIVVAGGFTLQNPAGNILAGLPFTSTLRPMNFQMQLKSGSTSGDKKKVYRCTFSFLKSLGGQYRANGQGVWNTIFSRDTSDLMDSSPPVFTGSKNLATGGNASIDASITVRQTQPIPLTVLAVTPSWEPTGT